MRSFQEAVFRSVKASFASPWTLQFFEDPNERFYGAFVSSLSHKPLRSLYFKLTKVGSGELQRIDVDEMKAGEQNVIVVLWDPASSTVSLRYEHPESATSTAG